jgi:hypothetical protein
MLTVQIYPSACFAVCSLQGVVARKMLVVGVCELLWLCAAPLPVLRSAAAAVAVTAVAPQQNLF